MNTNSSVGVKMSSNICYECGKCVFCDPHPVTLVNGVIEGGCPYV